jgi:hypothetical protein
MRILTNVMRMITICLKTRMTTREEMAQPTDDDILEEDNEVSMNTIRDNIASVWVSG